MIKVSHDTCMEIKYNLLEAIRYCSGEDMHMVVARDHIEKALKELGL